MEYEQEQKEYILSAVYKKSTCEEQDWCNTLKNGKGVMVKVSNVYRWGNFTIRLTETEKEELLEMDEVRLDDYDYELIEMWDGGCDFWIETVGEEDYTDSDKEEIESLLYQWKDGAPDDEDSDDDGYSYEKMEHNGWYESDCHIILGQCELKPVDGVDSNQ